MQARGLRSLLLQVQGFSEAGPQPRLESWPLPSAPSSAPFQGTFSSYTLGMAVTADRLGLLYLQCVFL